MSMHESKLRANWQGSFNGRGLVRAEGFETPVTLPKDFGGLGEAASPEDLLLAAVASCYGVTFGIVLDKAGVSYRDLRVDGRLLTKTGPAAAIEEVVLTVEVDTETPLEKLQALSERVDGFCLIAKAIKNNVKKTVQIVPSTLGQRREAFT